VPAQRAKNLGPRSSILRNVGEGTGRDTRQRLTVYEAAAALGITVDAVRSRIKRGTIAYEREGGRVYVLLGTDESRPPRAQASDQPTDQPGGSNVLISELRAHNATLREQLERANESLAYERQAHAEARRLLAAALERIPPQIEAPRGEDSSQAPPEPRESPETADSPGPRERIFTSEEERQEPAQPRPWWRRMFGG
jgi:hypothetical protein